MLSLSGRLGRASASALTEVVSVAVAHPNNRLVIDLDGVDYLSSAGIAALKEGLAAVSDRRVLVAFAGLREPVRLALELGGLLDGVAVEQTRELAVNRLRVCQDVRPLGGN